MDRKALTAALQSRDKTYVFLWTYSQFQVAKLKRVWYFCSYFLCFGMHLFIHEIPVGNACDYNLFYAFSAGAEGVGRC